MGYTYDPNRINHDPMERRFRFPLRPRMLIGPYLAVPQVDEANKVIRAHWVLPGRRVVTTAEARQIAKRNGWAVRIFN